MLGIRVSHCEKIMFMWLQWILVSLPWKDCVHLNYVNFEGSFSWDVHVTSVSNDESYHVKSIFMCTLWAMVSLTAPKSILMWTLWTMVNLTDRSPYSCELCELRWTNEHNLFMVSSPIFIEVTWTWSSHSETHECPAYISLNINDFPVRKYNFWNMDYITT
jgi:hypothetical protein